MVTVRLDLEEGDVLYNWSAKRIKNNKNVIIATTGPTGSGKSYNDLRKAEIIHKKRFNEEFPIRNCCFSVEQIISRLRCDDLRSGEVLILEEAGVNAGSGDWQNRVVKMFNYVLQSFRSMNIIMLMNLPVLSMLSKQARQLLHMHMETTGIDFKNGVLSVKPLCHQLNQHTGKSYWKYLRIKYGPEGNIVPIARMTFKSPSKKLIEQYETEKSNFLKGMIKSFDDELTKDDKKKIDELSFDDPDYLDEIDMETLEDIKLGLSQKESAKKRNKAQSTIWGRRQKVKKKLRAIEYLEKVKSEKSIKNDNVGA
jgi:hypothetical protein